MRMGAERRLKTEWANQIEQRPINWLWRPWFARGVITVVEGERGVGKSSLLFDVIARVTAGREFPQFEQDRPGGSSPRDGEAVGAGLPACPIREQDRPGGLSPRDAAPGKVLLLALEDPVDTVVAPRLEAAGADLANVVIVRKTEPAGGHGPAPESELELPRDFDLLAAQCRELRPHLLVIDSLFTALGMDENGRPFQAIDEPGMRRLLAPLKDLAEECQTAVVLVRRVNHAAARPARQRQSRLAGTAAAQARSVLLLAADPLAAGKPGGGHGEIQSRGGAAQRPVRGLRRPDPLVGPERPDGRRIGRAERRENGVRRGGVGDVFPEDDAVRAAPLHLGRTGGAGRQGGHRGNHAAASAPGASPDQDAQGPTLLRLVVAA